MTLTYRQLQAALKPFKAQGLTTIKLNGKKEALQAEYDRLTATPEAPETPQPETTPNTPEAPETPETNDDELIYNGLKNQAMKRGYSHQEACTLAEKAIAMTRSGNYEKAFHLFISRIVA